MITLIRRKTVKIKVIFLPSNTNTHFSCSCIGRSSFSCRHYLDLVDNPSLVLIQRNLIESQNICDFFRHPNPMQIIRAILNANPQAYRNTSKVNSLSSREFRPRSFFVSFLPWYCIYNREINKRKKDQRMLYIAEHCLKVILSCDCSLN